MPLSIANKPQLTGIIILFVGVALLAFTFLNAYLFLQEPFTILATGDLARVFGEALAPLIQACIRLMYLGIMGWIGSLLTIRGIPLVTHKPVPVVAPVATAQAKPQPQPAKQLKPAQQPSKPQPKPTTKPQPAPATQTQPISQQPKSEPPQPPPPAPQEQTPQPQSTPTPQQEEPKAILIPPENQKEE